MLFEIYLRKGDNIVRVIPSELLLLLDRLFRHNDKVNPIYYFNKSYLVYL